MKEIAVKNINLNLLKEQKNQLVNLIAKLSEDKSIDLEFLHGILNLLDYIQDALENNES